MGSVEGTILLEVEQLGVFQVPGTWNPVFFPGLMVVEHTDLILLGY